MTCQSIASFAFPKPIVRRHQNSPTARRQMIYCTSAAGAERAPNRARSSRPCFRLSIRTTRHCAFGPSQRPESMVVASAPVLQRTLCETIKLPESGRSWLSPVGRTPTVDDRPRVHWSSANDGRRNGPINSCCDAKDSMEQGEARWPEGSSQTERHLGDPGTIADRSSHPRTGALQPRHRQ